MLNTIAALLLAALSANFIPPVAYEMSLAGNFAEPRPNHFHGGIDIKTAGVEGKPIYSVGDGYVSRLTVGLFGFGNAVYVTHPEGVTSVYCHLRSFSHRIRNILLRRQYAQQSYTADISLTPLDCPVAKGQLIAISGNTGASTAPHLHFEMHDTRTWDYLDPLDFLSPYLKDSLPPIAHGFMACPLDGKGVFNGGTSKQTFGFPSHRLDRHFEAWGKVGFAIWANDYAENSYNHYGVRHTVLSVDGHEVFRSDVTHIPANGNPYVNSWGDYEHYIRSGVWYMRSFIEPGNMLPVLHAAKNNGFIDFNEERDYHLTYTLTDFYGNSSKYEFVVTGRKTVIPAKKVTAGFFNALMRWNRTNIFSRPGLQLVLPYGTLCSDIMLQPSISSTSKAYSPEYSFYKRPFSLFGKGLISIAVRKTVEKPEKLYIDQKSGMERYVGGSYRDGWVTAEIRELSASYCVEYDDRAPQITPLGEEKWEWNNIIRFNVADDKSGVKICRGYIDGQFILFEPTWKSHLITCRLTDSTIRKTGKKRRLKLVAVDNRDNEATFETSFVY